jgi:FkbM family methyltransferase
MAATDRSGRLRRWIHRLALMPHHTTETLQRLRAMEGTIEAIALSCRQPRPAPAGRNPTAPLASPLAIYSGYDERDLEVFGPFRDIPRQPSPGCITNFLGVTMSTDYVKGSEPLGGTLLGVPVPDDGWHSEAIEWIGLLKSVTTARDRYVALELGAGWGPWSVAGAAAARHLGIQDIHLHAVEADPGHFEFLLRHFQENHLDPAAHRLIQAAVGAEPGRARWPKVENPADDWGSSPMEAGASGQVDHIGRRFDEWMDVEIVGIRDLLAEQAVWDLVHIDVQGWEVGICRAAIALMDEKVRWVVIGTHDSKLHGDLIDLFFQQGWALENEKPPRFEWKQGARSLVAMTTHDGTQVWRNPKWDRPAE